jgi:hypothetical protein
MKAILNRKHRALSGVLVTIIVMVASIVLASGVVLYGTTLFQGGAQQESISVSGIKLWVHGTDSNGLSWGAFAVRNTGDKVLSVDRIAVRGTDVPFSQWRADADVTSDIIQQPMNFTSWSGVAGKLSNDAAADTWCTANVSGTDLALELQSTASPPEAGYFCGVPAAGPIGLDPGQAAIIYFQLNNGTVGSVDGGAQTSVSVFAGKTGAPQSIAISSKI